ncbi:MAG: methionine biosynthesis protein MetW [Phormidesmis sp.]
METLKQKVNLDSFYSENSILDWQKILGDDLHYHFGYFQGSEDLQTGLKQTIRNFYPYIPLSARVLDIGCGWGGPAKMLSQERQCAVKGITVSTDQAEYCRRIGIDVSHQDVEREAIHGCYDLIFMMEALSHIYEKAELLRRLRPLASRLVLSVNCAVDGFSGTRTTFEGSMQLCTVAELTQAVEQAGWRIQFRQNRRF